VREGEVGTADLCDARGYSRYVTGIAICKIANRIKLFKILTAECKKEK
jgi:hypothetical protein